MRSAGAGQRAERPIQTRPQLSDAVCAPAPGQPKECPRIASADALAAYLCAQYAGSERAASVVEFGLLAALIAAVCVIAVTFLGDRSTGLSGLAGS